MKTLAKTLGLLALTIGALGCKSKSVAATNGGSAMDPTCVLVREGFGPRGAVRVRAEVVAQGLTVPWSIGFLPDGDLLVTERPGRIRRVSGGRVSAPVATIDVGTSGEAGLLGLAIAPDFVSTRHFYVYLTDSGGGALRNRIERWTLSANGESASRDRTILEGIPSAQFHDGGRLRFGPDGMLYAGTGDARDPALARDRSSLAGKLLRMTADGGVPSDNPFSGSLVYLSGLRNLQAFDWRRGQTLVVADHGPSGELGRSGHDEVSVAKAGDDLGWPTIYGCEDAQGLVTPRISWQTAVPPGGAAFYTGSAIPEWKDNLLIGTLGSKHLHRVVFDDAASRVTVHEVYFEGDPPSGYGRLRDVIMGPDGHLYVTTSNCDGRGDCPSSGDVILRIVR